MARLTYSEFCGMAPVLGVLMSVLLMRISGDVSRKMKKGFRAYQRMQGQFSMDWPMEDETLGMKNMSANQLITLLLLSPFLCVHTTLKLVAKIPKYTAKSRSFAWPKYAPRVWSKTKKHAEKWSTRHWRHWKAWKWAYGRKNTANATSKEENKTYAEFKTGHLSKYSIGHLWKIDVKWTLRHGHFHLVRKLMSKSVQMFHNGMKHWYRKPPRAGKQPNGQISSKARSWWGHTKGHLGSANQIRQYRAKIAKVDSHKAASNENKYNAVLKQYNRRLSLYRKLPWKTMSRWWGSFNQLELPVWLRVPAYNLYIWLYSCKLHEAEVQDLASYRNLSEFFRRQLKHGLRPVDQRADLVSPADGRVLHYGKVCDGALEQVKGVFYSLQGFLGPLPDMVNKGSLDSLKDCDKNSSHDLTATDIMTTQPLISTETVEQTNTEVAMTRKSNITDRGDTIQATDSDNTDKSYDLTEKKTNDHELDLDYDLDLGNDVDKLDTLTIPSHEDDPTYLTSTDNEDEGDDVMSDADFADALLSNPHHALYHCIVYLAPGDYHRFHSPADWTVLYRRHFPGELFSVKPGIARWLQGLFSFNERVVYFGTWKFGFFSMTAVGATNVGSVNVKFDQSLETNTPCYHPPGTMFDKDFQRTKVKVKKGELLGDFNLGSTIVLVFEAPQDFTFTVENGWKVQYGQSFGGFHSNQ